MTQHRNNGTNSSSPTAAPHGSSQPPSEHPLFKGLSPFEATMLRVAMQDLHEDGLGCRPFIAATANLAPEVRRDLLLEASGALLGHCDRHGAAQCLMYALGLEHFEPSDELDRVIEAGLQIIAETADDDDDDLEDETGRIDELVRSIEEAHQGREHDRIAMADAEPTLTSGVSTRESPLRKATFSASSSSSMHTRAASHETSRAT